MRKRKFVLLSVALLFWAGSSSTAMTVAQNGSGKMAIVVDVTATEPVKHAAAELADFL